MTATASSEAAGTSPLNRPTRLAPSRSKAPYHVRKTIVVTPMERNPSAHASAGVGVRRAGVPVAACLRTAMVNSIAELIAHAYVVTVIDPSRAITGAPSRVIDATPISARNDQNSPPASSTTCPSPTACAITDPAATIIAPTTTVRLALVRVTAAPTSTIANGAAPMETPTLAGDVIEVA